MIAVRLLFPFVNFQNHSLPCFSGHLDENGAVRRRKPKETKTLHLLFFGHVLSTVDIIENNIHKRGKVTSFLERFNAPGEKKKKRSEKIPPLEIITPQKL